MAQSNEYDVVVAGAGMSGSLAAAMASKGGARVLLVDRNKEEEAGKKTNWGWVCGDAVAKSHLDFIKDNVSIEFKYPELEKRVKGVYALSPDLKSKFAFEGEGYVLNRPLFERKLLKMAVENGAEHLQEFDIEAPITEDGYVKGIVGTDKQHNRREIRASITIDALGIATNLRRKLPENPYVDRQISIDDIESTGRYICSFEKDHDDPLYYDPDNALIHLNQRASPGGYGWVFPKEGNRINIGLGVQKRSLQIRNERMNTNSTLHSLIDEYVAGNPVIKSISIDETDRNGKGYWSVSVRRQLESLVFNGYMGAGDSMAMPNPISAGGIGPALVAGILSGKNAAAAIQNRDFSVKGLWQYNLDFNAAYGKKTAGLEVFRIYLQSLSNEVINYGMKTFLTAKEAEDLSYGLVPELSLAGKFKMILKGATNINAFSNLLFVVRKMKRLNGMYEAFPGSPEEFQAWRASVTREMEESKERFKPSPV